MDRQAKAQSASQCMLKHAAKLFFQQVPGPTYKMTAQSYDLEVSSILFSGAYCWIGVLSGIACIDFGSRAFFC